MFTINFSLKYFLIFFLGISFFVSLGFWQIKRGHEKKDLILRYQEEQTKPLKLWNVNLPKPLQYQRLKVKGHYAKSVIFLDNQYYQHKWGYHVLSPFFLARNTVVMVDRGWVNGGSSRSYVPYVNTPTQEITLVGNAYTPLRSNVFLRNTLEKKQAFVWVIAQFDTKMLQNILHQNVLPFIIRLNREEPYGYVRDWQIVTMQKERHYAYAFQWFSLALLLLVLGVICFFKGQSHAVNK
ncbi:MAG: hypothetical protein A3F18_07720 [Legionellales bacterium RIFCSPHIGHO2_12_FULL_37_14]|nr:MAG: hypothetical protein A3F18_07720 [Legionellales bacterium RIFCSPHIGHO2_12_FULL_37_14]